MKLPLNKFLKRNTWNIVFAFLSVGYLFLIYKYFNWIYRLWKVSPDSAGQFGDMFGTITAVVGSLTVILLIFSLIYQRREIKLSRKELKNSTKELKLTREQIEKQTTINQSQQETMKLQRIDNTFFNLLDFNYKIKSKIDYEYSSKHTWVTFRKEGIENEFSLKKYTSQLLFDRGYAIFSKENFQLFRMLYNRFNHRSDLMNYYNSTIIVLKFIKESGVSIEKMEFYVETFAALFTPSDLCILLIFFRLGSDLMTGM